MATKSRFPGRRRGSASRSALATTLGVVLLSSGLAAAAELPLTRVVLSNAGLAQFTHEGRVSGGATVDLSVRLDLVDDVLKSLTVFDAAGAVGPVGLPGREPLAELFRDLPFDGNALSSPSKLLNALVGTEVEIGGPVAARGRVFRVEAEPVTSEDGKERRIRHRLSLLTDGGLVQAVLEDVTTLTFTDPQTRGQIDRALAGLAANRAKGRRTLTIDVLGSGERKIAVAYVVAAPIWKTGWRLVLPATGGEARLQGWAVLENLTGGDWNGVDLTLVSGDPVALTQPLYTAVYGVRTTVPVATGHPIRPPSDSGRTAADARAAADGVAAEAAPMAKLAAPARAAPAPMRVGAPPPPMAPVESAEARDAATQLVFRFPNPVNLATGHTLMLPFVDRQIEAERVWLYRPTTDPRHPLAALRLVNAGDTTLPGGIVTAYETAADGALEHVGDAVLPLIGRGEAKFLAFALDSKTTVRREDRGIGRSTVGTLADGVLTTTVRSRHLFTYEVTAPADDARTVVIEEARIAGWTPAATAGIEDTPTHHRLRVVAAAGTVAKAEFALERTDTQTVDLGTLQIEDVLARVRGLDAAGPGLRADLDRLATIVAAIGRAKGQREAGEAEREKITADQERLRANLQSVGVRSDLGRSYLETLRNQENRLAEIDRTMRAADETITAKRREAADLVHALKP
jgi:hypothetical protein